MSKVAAEMKAKLAALEAEGSPAPSSSGSQSPPPKASSSKGKGKALPASSSPSPSSSPAPDSPKPLPAATATHDDSDEEMGSDDEDEIMHEIPIFLSQKLAPNLHLFQYPVTDRIAVPESALNKGHKINARWKPLSKRFELEMPLDDRPDVYDPEKGEEFAEGARLQLEKETPTPTGSTAAARKKEDKKKEKEREERRRNGYEGNDGPKKALQSMKLKSEVVPDQTTYMAGSMRDGNLYLHPVNLQLQLRPNLDYLDALDERNRDEKRRERAGGEDSEEEAEAGPGAAPKKEEGKTISVTHKKTEGESKYGAASSSSALRQEFLQRMQSELEEPWIKLGWSDMESDKAQNVLDGLFDVPLDELECTTKPLDFLNEASIGA